MQRVHTLGLVLTDPQRGRVALRSLADVIAAPGDTDAVGQAFCVDGSVLLRRDPAPPAGADLSALLGAFRARTGVAQLRSAQDLRPKMRSPANLGPFRSKTMAFSSCGGPTDADHASALRDRYLAQLPDFLRRSVVGQTEAEAFFYAVLAQLHARGQLQKDVAPARVVDALRHVIDTHCADVDRHIHIATCSHVIAVCHRLPGTLYTLDGLDEDVASEVDATLCDSSIGRERLRRFRAIIAAGSMTPSESATAPGLKVDKLGGGAAVIIARDLEITEL